MNELEKEFAPYQESLELKELGFDEPCFSTYNSDKKVSRNPSHNMEDLPIEGQPYYWQNSKIHVSCITAPTFSQAFRWFREKHTLYHNIKMFGDWDNPQFLYIVSGRTMNNPAHMWHYEDKNSYEEAELACLRKLIEIVKGGEQ